MHVIQNVERKGYGLTAVWLAIVAIAGSVIYETTRAYNALCLTGGSGCLSEGTNTAIGSAGIAIAVIGAVAGVLSLVSAVESIAIMENTKKSYVALSILGATLILVSSGLVYLLIRNTAYSIFG